MIKLEEITLGQIYKDEKSYFLITFHEFDPEIEEEHYWNLLESNGQGYSQSTDDDVFFLPKLDLVFTPQKSMPEAMLIAGIKAFTKYIVETKSEKSGIIYKADNYTESGIKYILACDKLWDMLQNGGVELSWNFTDKVPNELIVFQSQSRDNASRLKEGLLEFTKYLKDCVEGEMP